MAEKYYSISPYAYVANNPMRFIDPTGIFLDDFIYNEKGELIKKIENNEPDAAYVIQTTKTDRDLYPDQTVGLKGRSYPISQEAAARTENNIKNGSMTRSDKNNLVKIGSPREIKAMLNSIEDDGRGGTITKNNKEYSGRFDRNGEVKDLKSSNSGKPSEGRPLVSLGPLDFHSHPTSSESFTRNGKHFIGNWQQSPSLQDINEASSVIGNNKIVVGMRVNTIYIYNKSGVWATIPTNTFK